MTRTVTLADISPARVVPTGKASVDPGADRSAGESVDASSFAQVLDHAVPVEEKAGDRDERRERDGAGRGAGKDQASACPAQVVPQLGAVPLVAASDHNSAPQVTPTASSSVSPSALGLGGGLDPQTRARTSGVMASVADEPAEEATPSPARSGAVTDEHLQVSRSPDGAVNNGANAAPLRPDDPGTPGPPAATPQQLAADPGSAVASRQAGSRGAPEVVSHLAPRQAASRDTPEAARSVQAPVDHGPAGEASPSVSTGPVASSRVGPIPGEFSARLDRAASAGTAQFAPRSEFVASNALLTAAISKPQSHGDGVYSVTAMINPPSLGHVQAVVKVDGTSLNVTIVAHTPEGHRAIEGHLAELRQELEAHGGQVQLSLSDGGRKGRPHDETRFLASSDEEGEDTDALVLTAGPAQAGKSLHVIL